MRISRAIGFQTLTTSTMFLLLVVTVTFYWNRIDSAQARIRDDALSLRDYRLLSEVVNAWLLSNDLVFASGQTYMVNGGLRQGEQIQALAKELSQESLSIPFQDEFSTIVSLVESNQNQLLKVQQGEAVEFQDVLPGWDRSSQEVVSNVVELGEILIIASEENARAAIEERRLFMALVAIECVIFSLLIFLLWRWVTRSIVLPIGQLTEAAEQALKQGTTLSVRKSRIDEVETLSESINSFTKSLESRVKERTQQLKLQQRQLIKQVRLRKAAQKVAQSEASKAIAASKAKSQFLANMSHEIRTPLNGIIGGAQLMGTMKLDDKAELWVKTIEDSSTHLLALVDAVFDFSQMDAGQLELSQERFDTQALLMECRSMFEAQATGKNLKLFFEIDPELPDELVGDKLKIQQIFTNLLSNAFKFTETGSIVFRMAVGKKSDESVKLLCQVSDTGIGIPSDKCNSIFDSFEQVDNSDSRKYGGSGLGLTLSRSIARKMDGDITVKSRVGKGSTFYCAIQIGLIKIEAGTNQGDPSELRLTAEAK